VQTRLSFNSDEIETAAEPRGFAVHALLDGELASHVQPVSTTRPGLMPTIARHCAFAGGRWIEFDVERGGS
jgi:hypothetical protein